jgi:hypothetical protein
VILIIFLTIATQMIVKRHCVLFVYSVFNENISNSDYVASNECVIVNIEFGRDVKEALVAQFELFFLYFA